MTERRARIVDRRQILVSVSGAQQHRQIRDFQLRCRSPFAIDIANACPLSLRTMCIGTRARLLGPALEKHPAGGPWTLFRGARASAKCGACWEPLPTSCVSAEGPSKHNGAKASRTGGGAKAFKVGDGRGDGVQSR